MDLAAGHTPGLVRRLPRALSGLGQPEPGRGGLSGVGRAGWSTPSVFRIRKAILLITC